MITHLMNFFPLQVLFMLRITTMSEDIMEGAVKSQWWKSCTKRDLWLLLSMLLPVCFTTLGECTNLLLLTKESNLFMEIRVGKKQTTQSYWLVGESPIKGWNTGESKILGEEIGVKVRGLLFYSNPFIKLWNLLLGGYFRMIRGVDAIGVESMAVSIIV